MNAGFTYIGFDCSFSTDCYDGAQTLPVNTEVTIVHPTTKNSTTFVLVETDGSGSFKVWKEKNGNKILNASGIFANGLGWQKKLTRAGTRYSNDFLDDPSNIAGRACPEKVFNSSSGPSTCLYYSSRLGLGITLQGSSTGVRLEDYIDKWTDNISGGAIPGCNYSSKTAASWYVGNIKTCADAGMRLPVLYEFKGWKSGCRASSTDCAISDLPPPGIVSESDSNGRPARDTWTATASSHCSGDSYDGKYFWQVNEELGLLRTFSSGRSESSAHVLCVLPGF
jgi:hypothetical protein